MMTAEESAWLAISGIKGVGTKTLWRLVDFLSRENKNAAWLLDHPDILEDQLKPRCSTTDISLAAHQGQLDNRRGCDNRISIIHPFHPDFPLRLKELRNEHTLPAILYLRGNINLLTAQSVSIVGARNVDDKALVITEMIAAKLARKNINVVSGYAKGIDLAAHTSSLKERGTTTIVLGEGLNSFKAKQIIKPYFTKDNTVVVSQFEPNARWSAHFAMTRNKLVCALSSAVIVIISGPERDNTGRMSGTFDAGLNALKMGIPIFVLSPDYFYGCPTGNKDLIDRGCIEFHPEQGIEPILEAINQVRVQPPASQKKSTKSEPKKKISKNKNVPDLFD
jgi:predicted Rossmann fold nucleotide-binding protein DprA/Smf involved in DNA uptake